MIGVGGHVIEVLMVRRTIWRSANKCKTYSRKGPTEAEVVALIQACSTRASHLALPVVPLRVTQWVSEAPSLCPRELARVAGTVRILNGKGSCARIAGPVRESRHPKRWNGSQAARGETGQGGLPHGTPSRPGSAPPTSG